MSFKETIREILKYIPTIKSPERPLSFKERLFWTFLIICVYYLLTITPLFGLSKSYIQTHYFFASLLAASVGSIITLGIGPIITGHIILEILVAGRTIPLNLRNPEDRRIFEGLAKIFAIIFILIENFPWAFFTFPVEANHPEMLVRLIMYIQLVIGGLILLYLDEICTKWGIGSGISLFIAAGVSKTLFIRAFNVIPDPSGVPVGAVPRIIYFLAKADFNSIVWPLFSIIATLLILVLSTYLQAVRIELPFHLGRVGGRPIRWPISLLYTSNIPVIFTAATIGTIQMMATVLSRAGISIFGVVETVCEYGRCYPVPKSGLVKLLNPPTIQQIYFKILGHTLTYYDILSIVFYLFVFIVFSAIFSYVWIYSAGQDPTSVAEQLLASGINLPGFRADKRILERVLSRYIIPTTILGGILVGILASLADIMGALARGTSILLAVMILNNFYERLIKQHIHEIPIIRQFIKVEQK